MLATASPRRSSPARSSYICSIPISIWIRTSRIRWRRAPRTRRATTTRCRLASALPPARLALRPPRHPSHRPFRPGARHHIIGVMSSRFHREALEMLNLRPEVDLVAMAALRARAQVLGIEFPPSFLDWYGMERGVELLKCYSNCDWPIPISELGSPIG